MNKLFLVPLAVVGSVASIAGAVTKDTYEMIAGKINILGQFLSDNQGISVAIFFIVLLVIIYSKYMEKRDECTELTNTLCSVKSIKTVCSLNNHKYSHLLRDSIFSLYALEESILDMIESKITLAEDPSIEEEINEHVFNKIEKIMCDYGCHIASSLRDSIDKSLYCLGYPNQKIRVLIKTIDDDTEVGGVDGTKQLSDDGGIITNAIWDKDSWKEKKAIIKENGRPKHNLDDSTALSLIARETCTFYVNNNTKDEKYYKPAPEIYEKGFNAKLALPIRYCGNNENDTWLFGFVVILIENEDKLEIFEDDPNSLLVSMGLSVADLLAILMSQIHFFHSNIEAQLIDKFDSIKQKRRVGDGNN